MSSILVTPPLPAESVLNSLNPQEAIHDTPNFRANVRKFEEQVDHFEKWLDTLFKALKHYSEESVKYNEASNNLTRKATQVPSDDSLLDRDFTLIAARIFADTLQTTSAFKSKLVNDIDEKLIHPISHFTKNELKEFKEIRRNHDRAVERYDSMLAKYSSQSRNKEASALREDAFQLHEVRKTYIKSALDYTLKIVQFRASIDHLIMDQFLTGTFAHLEMHEASLIVYKESGNHLERLRSWLSEKTCENQIPLIHDLRNKLEEEAINSSKPRRNLTTYTDNGANLMTIHPNSDVQQTTRPSSPASLPNETPTKQGYLFMRATGKNTWVRKYFYLKDGIFWWASVGHGKLRSTIEESERIGVLLCEVRTDISQDRRFCFEIVCGAKQTTYLLQAETDSDLKDWISVFENAKRHAFRSSSDLSSSAAAAVVSHKELDDEQNVSTDEGHDSNKPSTTGSVEADSKITLPSAAASPPSSQNSLSKKWAAPASNSPSSIGTNYGYSTSLKGSSATLAPVINNNGNIASSLSTQPSNEKSSTSANQQNFWGTLQWAMPTMNLIINTVNASEGDDEANEDGTGRKRSSSLKNKGGRSRSGSVPVGSGADSSIAEYPQNLLLHNAQLHLLFPCATEVEFVLNIFNCAWYMDDMLFKGRAYITQDKLYFYSIVMSVINMFWVSWRDVKSINYKTTDTGQIVDFVDENHNIEGVFHEKARIVWSLATGEKSVSLQSVFNAVWKLKSESKEEEKKDIVSEKSTEQKDEAPTQEINEKPSDKVEVVSQQNVNSDDHKNHLSDKIPVNEKIHTTDARTPSMITIPSPEDDDLPSNILQPKGPVKCDCSDHLEQNEVEHEFSISARKLFDIIFDEKSTIWSRLHKKKGNRLLHSGPWVIDNSGNGERKREFKFIMPVNNSMTKVKESECIETQICMKRDDYLCYSVLSYTKALQLPYNDAFLPMSKYCITYVSKTSCKLAVYIGIQWFKSPMVKSIIRRAAMSGLADTVEDLLTLIKTEVTQRKPLVPSSPLRLHPVSTLRRRPHSYRHHKSRSKISSEETQSPGVSTSKVSTNSPKEPKEFRESNSLIHNIMEHAIRLLTGSISNFVGIVTKFSSSGTLGIVLTLSLICNVYLWFGVGYNVINTSIVTESVHPLKTYVASPAVYIRDLEEQVLNSSFKVLKGVDPISFRQFLDTRITHPAYPWLLHSHHRMSDEISFARKKVAILRYDLLLTFQLINSIDKRLLESEYVNWLLDERAKCNKARWMLLKDDSLSDEEIVKNSQPNNISTSGNDELNSSSYDDEKHQFNIKSEYKAVRIYCGDVKRQLDAFSRKL
ncbi:15641_t:CDS:10 [Funneliformis caledonium]|uniref:15641_t:CDS:1 n=1 Tax=Funneliformis caledonium TaxID=1117310 RepID=A0A9N9A957_9GLOM|nr:15641_t:CDS:10 [Funneliformis caledonium]